MENESKIIAITNIPDLKMDPRDVHKAFMVFKDRGIIRDGSFDDSIWHLSDERTNCNIDFNIDEEAYTKNFRFLKIPPESMVYYMKTYVLFRLGELIVQSLQAVIREIKYLFKEPEGIKTGYTSHGMLYCLPRIGEFYSMLPFSDDTVMKMIQELCADLENASEIVEVMSLGKRRVLASFDSYLKFEEALTEFWRGASREEKLFFFRG